MPRDRAWEQSVVARVEAGDAAALADVYDQLGGYVYGLARRVLRDRDRAEDVTQEVFCQLWEAPHRFDPERGSLRTFLGVLTHRRAVDLIRSAEASRRREHEESAVAIPPDVIEDVDAGLVAAEVRRAVDQLPENQRSPIVLAYFGGCTFRQVAEVLGIPEGTAKSRIRMALASLSRSLAPVQVPS